MGKGASRSQSGYLGQCKYLLADGAVLENSLGIGPASGMSGLSCSLKDVIKASSIVEEGADTYDDRGGGVPRRSSWLLASMVSSVPGGGPAPEKIVDVKDVALVEVEAVVTEANDFWTDMKDLATAGTLLLPLLEGLEDAADAGFLNRHGAGFATLLATSGFALLLLSSSSQSARRLDCAEVTFWSSSRELRPKAAGPLWTRPKDLEVRDICELCRGPCWTWRAS